MLRKVFYILKAELKRTSFWVLSGSIVFFLLILSGVSVPDIANMSVGIVCYDSKMAEYVFSVEDSEFIFIPYEDEKSLKEDILSGGIDCGFVFDKDFDNLFLKGKMKESITCITSPYSNKEKVAKEVIFSVLLKEYSNSILDRAAEEILNQNDSSDILAYLHEKNDEYLTGSNIFRVDFNQED